jgi:hypothetical protein
MTNNWYALVPVKYVLTLLPWQAVRPGIVGTLLMNNSACLASVTFSCQLEDTQLVTMDKAIRQLNNSEWVASVMVPLSLSRLGVFAVVEITWQMDFHIWLSSVIVRYTGKLSEYVSKSKPRVKWIHLLGCVQLFSHFHAKIKRSKRHLADKAIVQYSESLVSYFLTLSPREEVHPWMVGSSGMNNSTCLSPITFRLRWENSETVTVSKVTRQLNDSEWVPSVMISCGRKDNDFVLCLKSHNKRLVLIYFLHLYTCFVRKRGSS